jgi:BioD-like phosphotransacetylase family protein
MSSAVQARMGEPVSDFHVVTTAHGPMLSDLMRLHRPLLVTSSDRVDYISSALAAHASGASPLAGVLRSLSVNH